MKKLAVCLALVIATALLGTPASGAGVIVSQGPTVISGAAAQFYGYVTPAMVVQKSGELNYVNFDIVQHDVVQDVAADGVANKKKDKWCKSFHKGECPLFWSPRASLGDQVSVLGLGNLKAGSVYTFLCTLHPGMKGRLVVGG
jgi:hypothetical protein